MLFIKAMLTFDDAGTREDRWKKNIFAAFRSVFKDLPKRARATCHQMTVLLLIKRYTLQKVVSCSNLTTKICQQNMAQTLEVFKVQENLTFTILFRIRENLLR